MRQIEITLQSYRTCYQSILLPDEVTPETVELNKAFRELCPEGFDPKHEMKPATYLVDALLLLEIIKWHNPEMAGIMMPLISQNCGMWAVTFDARCQEDGEWFNHVYDYQHSAEGESLQLAIARAAKSLVKIFSLPTKGNATNE